MPSRFPDIRRVQQIGYVVPDIRAAVEQHCAIFGSGPFFLTKGLDFDGHIYRGRPWRTSIDIALGQWGDLQLEFIQIKDDGPSVFSEILPRSAGPQLHHLCLHPDNIEQAIEEFAEAGHVVAFDHAMPGGTRIVMIDTVSSFGHFIELYERTEQIGDLYDFIRRSAEGPRGDDVLRPMPSPKDR